MRMVVLSVAAMMLTGMAAAAAMPAHPAALGRAAAIVSSQVETGCWFRRWCGPTRCHRAFVCR